MHRDVHGMCAGCAGRLAVDFFCGFLAVCMALGEVRSTKFTRGTSAFFACFALITRAKSFRGSQVRKNVPTRKKKTQCVLYSDPGQRVLYAPFARFNVFARFTYPPRASPIRHRAFCRAFLARFPPSLEWVLLGFWPRKENP